jgi:SulP family sulfate permease
MTAAAVSVLISGDQQRYAETAAALALAVSAVFVLAWLARLGFLAGLLSHPVLIGYMAGIAVLIIVSQLGNVTGIPVEGKSVLSELRSLATQLDQLHRLPCWWLLPPTSCLWPLAGYCRDGPVR